MNDINVSTLSQGCEKWNWIQSRHVTRFLLFTLPLLDSFLASIGSLCWHEIIIEEQEASLALLLWLLEKINELWNAPRSSPPLTSPRACNPLHSLSLSLLLYWEINFILIWNYVFRLLLDYCYLSLLLFFRRSHRIHKNKIGSDQANAIMRLNFSPSPTFFTTTWLLFRQASMNREMVTFSDRKYWYRKDRCLVFGLICIFWHESLSLSPSPRARKP